MEKGVKLSPSALTADNQCAVDIGIFVHKTVESILQFLHSLQCCSAVFLQMAAPRYGYPHHPRLEEDPATTWVRHTTDIHGLPPLQSYEALMDYAVCCSGCSRVTVNEMERFGLFLAPRFRQPVRVK
ncbi:hypothetical protein PR048_013765 [Dryococelus australis]|uniref:Uncharacterized protein n=1 Tax=Dryococelus australis TaxID=614101 RepID=A0ABQ9HT36_9NEOP|nr:hypothetical protein PR048_013765 [Dryococelus australis]